MVRIGTGDRLGPAQVRPARPTQDAAEHALPESRKPPARALTVIEGGLSGTRRDDEATPERPAAGRPRAGFVVQLLTAHDLTLLPSRLERTRIAAASYAESARRLG
jgi:hypothetical protein